MADKFILDVTCGNRQIWFQKNEPHTIYCDIRKENHEIKTNNGGTKTLNIDPDVVCDFTNLPFADNTFSLVVFDPPHAKNLSEASWLRKEYGSLQNDWKPMIKKGFRECMRVLKPNGVLIFKWSAVHIPTREIINVIGEEPLFGHRSGKKMNTHWLCFMKLADRKTEPTISKMEQVDEPQTCDTCKYGEDKHKYAHICNECGVGINNYEPKDEPQTERSNNADHIE